MPPGLPGMQRPVSMKGKALPEWNGRQIQESCRCLWVVGETWAEEPKPGFARVAVAGGGVPTGTPKGLPELLWLGVVPTGAPKVLPELPWLGMSTHWDS